jgi:RNA polymerase sigma-70 factor, ECF subfamily
MTTDTAESRIVKRLQDRDPLALAETYDRYGRPAYSLILRIVHDGAIAQDVVQETFLRVWNGAPGFDADRGAFGPWLLSIAHHCAIDYHRSSGRERSAVEWKETDHPSLYVYSERDILASDNASTIRTALLTLAPRHRKVIELAYFEGLTQTEMAERMGQRLGTVKTWVRAALKHLRDELERGGSFATCDELQGRSFGSAAEVAGTAAARFGLRFPLTPQ